MGARDANPPQDDQELVRLARGAPDEATRRRAAADLLGRYRVRVYAWCLRHVHNHDQALDLAQDVLLTAYQKLASYRSDAPFAGWLWAVARNRCLNELRRPRLLSDEAAGLADLASDALAPDEELIERLDEERLVTLIRETLDPLEQQALRLRCFERMPVDAITAALGITETTGARAVLQRSRRKLRAALSRQARDDAEERP
ncbi:MAG: sigma-70 family RNA polymerase sigma factor [Candidatus Krumholzibacteriia bacterium]